MHKNIPIKSIVPNLLSGVDYSKLISNQSSDNQNHNYNKELKGRSLKLNKKLNNYHNKTF